MDEFSHARLEIDLQWKAFDGRFMTVESKTANQSWQCHNPDQDHKITVVYDIQLPTQVQLKFSGKQQGQDTRTDEHGNILEDMAVIITEVRLDGFAGNHNLLHNRLVLETDQGHSITSNFMGFNGILTMDLAENYVLGVVSQWNC